MGLSEKVQLERDWHESEDFARDDSSLIVGVYGSTVFVEAEAYTRPRSGTWPAGASR